MTDNLVDLVCMLYHEARNVRHPIKCGRVPDAERFKRLKDLACDPLFAWRQMEQVRARARAAKPPATLTTPFERAYGLALRDLAELFDCRIWKDSDRGGNAWTRIARAAASVLEMDAASQQAERDDAMRSILAMPHNTGIVEVKLRRLRGAGSEPSQS